MTTHIRRRLTVLSLLALGACTTSPRDVLPFGRYGNGQTLMTVTATGSDLIFGCGTGRIDGAIPLDDHGRFDIAGGFSPGPISFPPVMARYTGSLSRNFVYLTGAYGTPTQYTIGPYALVKDGPGPSVTCQDSKALSSPAGY